MLVEELVARQLAAHLPPPPARVLDVGGPGSQGRRLAAVGYPVTAVGTLASAPVDSPYEVVLCHGALAGHATPAAFVDALAPAVAPGGLLSLLVPNPDGRALRPGMRGDWAGVQAALDEAESPAEWSGAGRLDELTGLLRRRRIRLETWYGVGVLGGDRLPGPDEATALLAAEERLGRTDPYRRVAELAHLVGRARLRPGDEPQVSTVAYDSPAVQALTARVQGEYVVRYGGGDASPVDPREFDPPLGAFLLLDIEGEPVACGGYRRFDERSAELKRMYVVPEHRGRGLARFLLQELERRARAVGYTRLLAEAGTGQPEAIALYTSTGYARVPGFGLYRHSPGNRCFAKDL